MKTQLLILICMTMGQLIFSQSFVPTNSMTPEIGVFYSSIAVADVDNDDYQDLLITGVDNSNNVISMLYMNDGSGAFDEALNLPFPGVFDGDISFADIDGDSDQDVLLTGIMLSREKVSKLYLNDGEGNFSLSLESDIDGVYDSSIAFEDVDGDEDLDLLISGSNSSYKPVTKLYLNNGLGHFTVSAGTSFEAVANGSIAFSDIELDGDQDIVITGMNSDYKSVTKFYINDGTGSFEESTSNNIEGVFYSSIAFSDIDNDSDPDLLITGVNGTNEEISQFYINDGKGRFEQRLNHDLVGVRGGSIDFTDLNGDKVEDLIIIGQTKSVQPVSKLYLNDGHGIFSEVLEMPFENIKTGSVVFVDVNNDMINDLIMAGENNLGKRIVKLYISKR